MEKEKINWQGYAPEKNSEYFKKHTFRYSVMCICGIILLAAAANLFFNVYREIFGADLKLFDSARTVPVVISYDSDEPADENYIQIGIENCEINDDSIKLTIYGKNNSDEEWAPDGRTFVISSLNTTAAGKRNHYYTDELMNLTVPAHQDFIYNMEFSIRGVKQKMNDGYVFSLSAFRNTDLSTVEIVLEDK